MVALQVRALAEAGYDVLQIDLLGCGDSSGNFEDAGWEQWLNDSRLATEWLLARSKAPLWLWGLRSGALLAADLGRRLGFQTSHIYWQPVLNGETVLRDFLRLAVAGELMSGRGRERLSELKARLAAGKSIEVAGYLLSAAMAKAISAACLLVDSPAFPRRVCWLDIVPRPQTNLPATVAETISRLDALGCNISYAAIVSTSFWQTADIVTSQDLVDATLGMVGESL